MHYTGLGMEKLTAALEMSYYMTSGYRGSLMTSLLFPKVYSISLYRLVSLIFSVDSPSFNLPIYTIWLAKQILVIRSVSLDQGLSSSLLSWGSGKARSHLDAIHMSGEDSHRSHQWWMSEDTHIPASTRQSKAFRVTLDMATFAINMRISKPDFTRMFSMKWSCLWDYRFFWKHAYNGAVLSSERCEFCQIMLFTYVQNKGCKWIVGIATMYMISQISAYFWKRKKEKKALILKSWTFFHLTEIYINLSNLSILSILYAHCIQVLITL